MQEVGTKTMKQTIQIIGLGLSLAAFSEAAGPIRERSLNQQSRIRQGVVSRQLTAPEAARLAARESNLHRTIVRDRWDGGGLTRAERLKIDRRQDALSRDIYRQKHDGQTRGF